MKLSDKSIVFVTIEYAGRVNTVSALGLTAVLLGACAPTVTANLPPAPPVPLQEPGANVHLAPYRVQVGDVLDVKLFLNPELNEEVTVRPDGMISTALAQDVPAFGRTPSQIAAELARRYHRDLWDPQTHAAPRVTVVVHTFAPNRIYVAGEVEHPGEFVTVGPNLTLTQAIARAGGVKLSADRGRIFIIRRDANDVPHALGADYLGVLDGERPTSDVRLAQYDIVIVPRTGIYETWTYWNQYLQQFLPVGWGFSYNINPVVR